MPTPRRPGSGTEASGFLHRPVAIVTLVSGVVGIVAAFIGVFGGGGGDGGGDDASARIDQCIRTHGLPSASERRDPGEGRIVFRACTWPAPPGAESDGFSEITVASREGPGQSEAEGLTRADVLTSTCDDLEARYLFDNQGTFVPEQPIHITKGEVRRVEGGSLWFPSDNEESERFTPRRDESIILAAARYSLDTLRCI